MLGSWLVISCLILKMVCFGRGYSQGMPPLALILSVKPKHLHVKLTFSVEESGRIEGTTRIPKDEDTI